MAEYVMLCGLPGSGKSTYIRNFLAKTAQEWVIISTDDVLEEYAKRDGISYSEAFKEYSGFASKEMHSRLDAALKAGKNIIHDQTNMSVKIRRKFLNRAEPFGYVFKIVVFSIPDPELKARLAHREVTEGKKIPHFVISQMAARYEAPTKAEGFSEITYVRK